MSVTLKIKKLHEDAVIPKYATVESACFDLHAVGINGYTVNEHEVLGKEGIRRERAHVLHTSPVRFRTGLAFEVPKGYALMIYSRSGHGFNHGTRLANCVGVIDSDYRGEVQVKLTCDEIEGVSGPLRVRSGDRIAQAMLVELPRVTFEEVDELSDTARGDGGFGSTGS